MSKRKFLLSTCAAVVTLMAAGAAYAATGPTKTISTTGGTRTSTYSHYSSGYVTFGAVKTYGSGYIHAELWKRKVGPDQLISKTGKIPCTGCREQKVVYLSSGEYYIKAVNTGYRAYGTAKLVGYKTYNMIQ
jgi:hypothetical protein